MSGLFNGNSSVAQPTAATKEVEAPNSSNSNDFSAAIASIGTAIGELKEAFPSMMETAFTTVISSDATNNALYDALASATYDSMAALHDEGKLGPSEREKSSETESRGGRGFTRAELLAIETLDQNEQLANAISTAFDKSLEKSKFDRAADVGAAAAKAAVDTSIDATAETAKGVGKTGLSVGLEATRGTLDLVGQLPAGVIESAIARNPGPLLDRLFGSLEKTGTNVIDKGVDGMADTAKNVSSKTIDNVKKGASNVRDAYAQDEGESVVGIANQMPGDDNNRKLLMNELGKMEEMEMTIMSTSVGGPNSMKGQPNPTGADISRKRMMDDMSMNFMSKTAPDFMSKGNEVFDKILNDELTVHLDEDIGQSVGMSMRGLPWGAMLKGGGMLALGAATIASLGAIATAGKALWDWHKTNEEVEKNLDNIAENSAKGNERMKNGVNDDLRDANIKDDKASVELAKAENGIGNSILGAFGYKTDEIREKEAAKMQAKAEQAIEQRRYRELLDRAEAYGIKRNDSEAVKKWVEEQKKLATQAGVNVEDKGAFIRFQNEELKRYKEAQKKAVEQGTQPNQQGQGQQGQQGQQPNNGAPDAANQANGAPMAAGSNANTTQNTVNAGTGAMTEDILSAEERIKQFKLYTFEGIRDALLLPEVQAMFSATAQTAGASVEQKLMG